MPVEHYCPLLNGSRARLLFLFLRSRLDSDVMQISSQKLDTLDAIVRKPGQHDSIRCSLILDALFRGGAVLHALNR